MPGKTLEEKMDDAGPMVGKPSLPIVEWLPIDDNGRKNSNSDVQEVHLEM